jgi:hypothetical protein
MGLHVFGLLALVAATETSCVKADRRDCNHIAADTFFFPAGSLGDRSPTFDADQFTRKWYSEHLRAMSEPSLSCKEPVGTAYRFLWLRTWGAPVAVRVEKAATGATLIAVELDGAGGYEPGKVSRRVRRSLTASEWDQIVKALLRADFWEMTGHLPADGQDGAQWIFEGRNGSAYHVVDRWSPETGAFRDVCLLLVRLAGLLPSGKGEKDAIY